MKKLIILGLVAALVAALALPMAVSATAVTGHVLATPTVTHVYMHGTSTAAHGAPTAVAPSGAIAVDIIGTGFDFPLGTDPTPVVATSAGVHITVGTVTVISATEIDTTFTIDTAWTSGNYNVTVAQGGRTSSTSAADYFLVNSYGTVTAPSDISLGLMTVGATATANGAGSLSTNDTTWSVTVSNTATSNPTNQGYMSINGNGTGGTLINKFQISKDGITPINADTGLSSGTTYVNSGTSLPLYVSQQVVTGDAAGTYSITITFAYSPQY